MNISFSPSKDYISQIEAISQANSYLSDIDSSLSTLFTDYAEDLPRNAEKNVTKSLSNASQSLFETLNNFTDNISIDFDEKINTYNILVKNNIIEETFPFDDWFDISHFLNSNSDLTERLPNQKIHKEKFSKYYNFYVTPILNLFLDLNGDKKFSTINIENFTELKNSISNHVEKTTNRSNNLFHFYGGFLLDKINDTFLKFDKKEFLTLLSTRNLKDTIEFLNNGTIPKETSNKYLLSAFINQYYNDSSLLKHEREFFDSFIFNNTADFINFSTRNNSSIFFSDKKWGELSEDNILSFIHKFHDKNDEFLPIKELIQRKNQVHLLEKIEKIESYLDLDKKIVTKESPNSLKPFKV